ncbi:MAG: glycosyltransferase, partial [Deltaproteobacteria bacterium]|nr:glycosyltransferase [Deltaproteobacteria bacterium]
TPEIRSHRIVPSFLNALPLRARYYRHLLPLFPFGAKDLERKLHAEHRKQPFDVVISISHCAVKNIQPPPGVPHICYCLTPMRYLWDQFDAYFGSSPFRPIIRAILNRLRPWDIAGSKGVTHFVGISNYIRERIERCYGRSADVIFPPVRTEWIAPRAPDEMGKGFLVVNALVPYKNTRAIIEAFNELRFPLTIVGKGPERSSLEAIARDNIRFVDWASEEELSQYYRASKALVFAADEDFGISPVEMQAAGRPVIALGRGGSLETVVGEGARRTGVYFSEPTRRSIIRAVSDFLDREKEFTLGNECLNNCVSQAQRFSAEQFATEFRQLLAERLPLSRDPLAPASIGGRRTV